MHPFSTPENIRKRKVFWCFEGVEKGCIRSEWVKIYLYKSRSYGFVCLTLYATTPRNSQTHSKNSSAKFVGLALKELKSLLEIKKINCLEKKIAEANANKHRSYLLKWNKIDNQLKAYN